MLAFLHALLNPLVSSFMSKEFRKAARRALNALISVISARPKLERVTHNGVDSRPEGEEKQEKGTFNGGATLSFETLTEATELPKVGE